ncbi:zinc finger MYM-type protein 1-like [Medicago truncatula]|uniref:zinc finger MYM-type protein 1-like n=1 Tax=Medicago truncatula TaxID=3880 RepID=UPI00023628F2|nr:zinc finger MYM-type protein 1-like [Medicago truncatula]
MEENESCPSKINRVDPDDIENSLERDPGKRIPIYQYPPNQKDAIRRAYLKWGPYQSNLENYPMSGIGKAQRRFQHSWFSLFSSWLEYSPSEDAAYCLQCYLFSNKPSGRPGSEVFISTGFRSWRKVRNGENCSFLKHIGKDPRSPHNNAMKACQDFLNQDGHLRNVIEVQSSSQILNNRLCLKTSIDTVRWLTIQACAFRGHREGNKSRNQGNFLELLKLLASYNDEVAKVVLKNALEKCKYTSHQIQKEILQILSSRVRKHIREEIGDSKFCIVVDEACDESKKEQMALVLRFVDKAGLIQERFFDVARVNDTASLTLKEAVCGILSRHNLDVSNIRGQGYDGASNMRGEWNGLQALFMKDCPYAYYVHCFAHRLQLALVTASREVASIHKFFEKLTFVVNVVGSSTKRHDELQAAQAKEIENLLETGEIVTGKGKNQVGTVKRAGDTRWGSHFNSICSLISMYEATCTVLKIIAKDAKKFAQRADADSSYNHLKSFDFIFILHLMKEIMGTTDLLCQALQKQSQDVVNAVILVRSTKALIQDLRENGWDKLFANVVSFCEKHDIEVPDLNDCHSTTRFGRSRLEENQVRIEHYFRVEIFFTTIDKQLQELNSIFSEQAMDLLTLSCALSPEDGYKAFDINTICTLVEKYYPMDFSDQEKINLPFHLKHFLFEARESSTLKNLSTIQELCSCLAAAIPANGQPKKHLLLDRLLRLVMTLPVSTATTERSFSAMKIIKSKLRNKMEHGFLANSMSVYIERDISECISYESIIDDFKSLRKRKVRL